MKIISFLIAVTFQIFNSVYASEWPENDSPYGYKQSINH